MADAQVKRKIAVSPHARVANYNSRSSSPTKSTRPSSPSKRSQTQVVASPSEAVRPRAKVSSSASSVGIGKKPPSALSPGYRSGTSTPRAPSPVRQQVSQQSPFPNGIGSRTLSRVRSRAALSAVSAPSSPRVANVRAEYASLSAATSDSVLSKASPPRARRPSVSSVSQVSSPPSALRGVYSPPSSVVSFSQDSDTQSNVSTHRIKAKLSSLAKVKPPAHVQPSPLLMPSPTLSRSPSQAPLSPTSQVRRLGRTISTGSFSAPPTPPQIYPITTASPAANVHRYATLRSPSYSHRLPQPFASPLQTDRKPYQSDPTLVPPLPPLSPAVPDVSFSSHSSAPRPLPISTSRTATPGIHLNGAAHLRRPSGSHTLDSLKEQNGSRSTSLAIHDPSPSLRHRTDSSEPDLENSEEQSLKAEAKSFRKIADLEITTKSLLAINSQLEANKHKQAKEIGDLRRKLRESQLALPPRTYRELKASGNAVDDEEPDEQEMDGDEDARLTAEAIRLGKDDEVFERLRIILENLLANGKQALAVKVEDLAPPKGTAKVLHEVEARTWRGDSGIATCRASNAVVVADATADDGSSSSSDYGEEITSRTMSSTRSEKEVKSLIGNLRYSLSANLRA